MVPSWVFDAAQWWFHPIVQGLTPDLVGWGLTWAGVIFVLADTRFIIRAWQAATLLAVYGIASGVMARVHAGQTDPLAILAAVFSTHTGWIWAGILLGRVVWFLWYLAVLRSYVGLEQQAWQMAREINPPR